MRKSILIIISAVLLVLSNGVSAQAGTSQFDGAWKVTLSCEPSFKAEGYTYQFAAQVKDGMLLGQYGEENKPGFLKISGPIEADGSSMLEADGTMGKNVPKGWVPGQTYNYAIKAQFKGSEGTGIRMNKTTREGRKCDFIFVKK